jgi:hypothetical protein
MPYYNEIEALGRLIPHRPIYKMPLIVYLWVTVDIPGIQFFGTTQISGKWAIFRMVTNKEIR